MALPRVRFAPSPTGYLHVGGARVALFNWLFARGTGGVFILRIEDTDPERSRDVLVDGIVTTLHWLGLDWDEGPLRQSQRFDRYSEVVGELVAAGHAYWCECTREDIDARVGRPKAAYDGYCRDRGLERAPGRGLRFRTPDEGETVVHDLIRGDVAFAHDSIEDFVIVRADGSPTIYVPNLVDDVDMDVSHVIRGEDLLSVTPRVSMMRAALGMGEEPAYAHLPLIVDEKRRPLSKRYHSVAVEEFRERGYLPEALRNYIALLGWAPGDDREVLPIAEMVRAFRPEDVKPSAAFFDVQKLDHVNSEYIRALSEKDFVRESLPWLESEPPWPPERFDLAAFEKLAPHVQQRVRTLAEVPAAVDFVFLEEPVDDPAAWEKVMGSPFAAAIVEDALAEYAAGPWDAQRLHDATLEIASRHNLKLAKAQAPVRVAVTGRNVGPPLFESLEALGRDCALERLERARSRLKQPRGDE
ncbi:MAG: glutamate--tRNA ligase [Acidimicrobiales bacterium]